MTRTPPLGSWTESKIASASTSRLRSQTETHRTGLNSLRAVTVFIVLAFAWSWGVGFGGFQVRSSSPLLSTALMMIAGFGPSLAGGVVVGLSAGSDGLRAWLARCLNWRLNWRWFALAFFTPPAVMICALMIDVALGGAPPTFSATQHIPLAIANFGLVFLIGGPLGEEFGWRGYLTPALTARMNWRIASLVIGVIWGLWHLPLFFLPNTAQAEMPIPLFMLNIAAGSVLFGWLFERTQRSVLPALVLHTSLNAWAGILVVVPTVGAGRPYELVTAVLVLGAAALLILPDRGRTREQASSRTHPSC